ncbi:Protein kinase domain-containing protein [Mycena kentingensis (nom. inval.)]|nr:Protein kinase domain-containing protein [Mycena kentingensis (nom. inval.)]
MSADINAPLGAWPADMDRDDVHGRHLSVSGSAIVHTSQDERHVLKVFYSLAGKNMAPEITYELRMMLLAGEDISVKVEGRLIVNGELEGFVMPRETTLDLALPKTTKRQWIEQLQSLVRRMHNKGIIHGDIKPDNVLIRNGRLILCDFAAAQLKAEAKQPTEGTTAYQSAWRCRQYDLPLCEADDLYALGVSIWHIWVGRAPFDVDNHGSLDDDIAGGLKPDLDAVDDKAVRGIIEMYLESAPAAR